MQRVFKILVAGAGKGIGKAVADLASERGYEVLAISRNKLDFKERPYPAFVFDVNSPYRLSLLRSLPADAVINCTGTHPGLQRFRQASEVEEIVAENLGPALQLYEAFLSKFRAAGRGHFVHISSAALDFHEPVETGYCTSKAALESLVLCLQNEDADKKVLHHAVRVSLTDTPLARRVCPQVADWESHYTARETAAYLLDVVGRPEVYPHPIITLPYRPVRS
jgi:NAD(P)-dependent dehydrogenase (short-subunit alcohol dehydrogenase family)